MQRAFMRLKVYKSLLLASLVFLSACQKTPKTLQLQGYTMGTTYHITLSQAQATNPQTLQAGIDQRLQQLNQIFSTYIPDSEISRFNRATAKVWFPVSPDLVAVVRQAEQISLLSQGYFDISLAPLINLWGFGRQFKLDDVPPDAKAIAAERAKVGYQQLHWRVSPPGLKKQIPSLEIDTSALAKGYAVDQIALWLQQQGFSNYLVEIGGELRTRGQNPGAQAWQVAIEKPTIAQRSIQQVISVSNIAVASSGNYRNYFEYQGQSYGHSLNPFTGYPVSDSWAAVTVLADNTMLADAWATALMVLPAERGKQLALAQNLAVLLIAKKPKKNQQWQIFSSPAFFKYTKALVGKNITD